ncbi:hypothetical protein MMC15_003625 [Xylographa vitiligo]|nr:hypothetical protein [Xylographa vitiligo]
MATDEATFDDPWDETAVNERRKPNRPLMVQRGDIVSLDLAKSFDGVPKLDGRLHAAKGVINLPSSSEVCPSCGDLESDVQGLPLSHLEETASDCPVCMIVWLGIQQCRSRWQSRSTSTSSFLVDIYPRGDLPVRVIVDWGTPEAEDLNRAETVLVLDFSSQRKEDKAESKVPWFGFWEILDGDYIKAASVARLSGLLDDCIKKHRTCGESQFHPKAVPKRLLALDAVDGSITVKLWETSDKQVPFVALSHCWGKLLIIRTTRENYQDHLSRVSFDSLPKTFQDAVRLTLYLGQKYMWIDSLCIVQDDQSDWANEAAKMGDIYENAMFVIAASSAADASIGIKRLESTIYPLTITNGPEELGTIIIRRPFDHTGYLGSYDASLGINLYNGAVLNPVESRAWTLQEELHARRLVKFTAREMIFQCLERRKCECGELNVPLSGRVWGIKKNVRVQKNKYHPKRSPEIWYDILDAFQDRDITSLMDRLPALSATAQRLFREPKHYIAGLPRDELPRYLLWGRVNYDLPPQPRPKDYLAPTWSWASISEKCEPSVIPLPGHKDDLDELVPNVWTSRLSAGLFVRIEDVKVEYASADPFGKLKSAQLTVVGDVCEAYLEEQEIKNKYLLRSSPEKWIDHGHPNVQTSNVNLDVDIQDASTPDYVTKEDSLRLLLFQIKSLRQLPLYALILRKEGDKLARIGVAYDLHKDWAKTRTCSIYKTFIV